MESVRLRLALVAPLRVVLSIVWLVAARAAGAPSATSLPAYATGAVIFLFIAFLDPRARFRRAPELHQLPANFRVAPVWTHAAHAAVPSTVGVSALAALALLRQPTLAALLAGVLAGLGVAALIVAYGMDPAIYLDTRRGVVFRR